MATTPRKKHSDFSTSGQKKRACRINRERLFTQSKVHSQLNMMSKKKKSDVLHKVGILKKQS